MTDLTAPARPDAAELTALAAATRARVLEMVHGAGLGHPGGDLSAADILTTLYFAVLRVDPRHPDDPERDRYIQSKGHASGVLYATRARRGFIADALLDSYMAEGSALNGHPDRTKVPGVETNTGPLGHGMPVAVGTAIAAKLDGSPRRTYVLTGDGELQEGSNWEAFMSAAHHRLDNLVVIVDRNRLQQGARTEDTNGLDPLDDKFAAFGWAVRELDGNDPAALLAAFDAVPFAPGRPSCIIANTIKGRGVSFMEDRVEWHHKVPSREQLELALEELRA
jgi:transketolase